MRNEFDTESKILLNRLETLYLRLSRWQVDARIQLETKKRLLDFMVMACDSLLEAKLLIEIMESNSADEFAEAVGADSTTGEL